MRLFCFMLQFAPTLFPMPMTSAAPDSLFSAIVHVPFGGIGIRTDAGQLREIVYLPKKFPEKDPVDPLAERVAGELMRYIADPDHEFRLPLPETGTAFQRRVWQAIAAIPRGEVLTYGLLARQIGSAPRAVGQACGANWFPLVIPCHRVTAAGGIGGFAHHDDDTGFHLGVKRWLLAHEGVEGYR